MFGQMTAGSWIYIGTQGILQGTYQTFAAAGERHFGSADLSRTDDPHRRARRHGRRPAARGDDGGRRDPLHRGRPGADRAPARDALSRRGRRLARRRASRACGRRPRSGGRSRSRSSERGRDRAGTRARRRESFDLVTDQTAAHDPLTGYVPAGLSVDEAASLRASDPDEYLRRARESIARHVEGLLDYVRAGSYVFDYGNNLRGEAYEAGVDGGLHIPGLRPGLYPAALLSRHRALPVGRALGRPGDIAVIDESCGGSSPTTRCSSAGSSSRPSASPSRACPPRICWLGYGDRARPASRSTSSFAPARSGAGRDRARPPRLRLGGVPVPRDRGDARRLRRDRRLADPERAAEHGGGRDVGERPPRRRRRDRQLDPRRHGRRRRRHRRRGGAARARADDRPRHGRDAPRRRRLRGGARRGARARPRPAERRAAARPTVPRLLVRDLAQVASPRGRGAPLRGRARSRELDVLESGYVLCDGGRSPRSARCASSGRSTATSRSSTAAGSARYRGSSTATRTRRSAATASTSSRYARAERPTRSCTPPAAASSRPSRDARGGRGRPRARPSRATATGCCAPARRRSRPSRATGSTVRPSSHRCARSARPAASRPGSARTRCRRSTTTRTPTSTSCSRRCCPRPRSSPKRPTSSSSAARSTRRRRAATSRPARGRARPAPARRPVHRVRRDPARDRARRAFGRPPRGDRPGWRRALAESDVVGVLLPASALFLDRPMPPARALVDAGAAVALATDFNPGQRLLREPAARLLPRRDAAAASARPRRSPPARSTLPTFSAEPIARPARAWLRGRPRRCSTLPTGATSPTTSVATWSQLSSRAARSPGRARHTEPMPTRKQRRRREKLKRHECEEVYVDEEGPSSIPRGRGALGARARAKAAKAEAAAAGARRPPVEPPSLRRTLRRGLLFFPLMLLTVFLLGNDLTLAQQIAQTRRPDGDLPAVQLLHGLDGLPLLPAPPRAERAKKR